MGGKNQFKHDPKTKFEKADNLTINKAREQVDQLREALEYHNYLYYIQNKPEISDKTYDALFSRLQELEEVFPDLQHPSSPTRRIGAPQWMS